MIQLSEAQEFIFKKCQVLPIVKTDISASRGLVTAETVTSNENIPPFSNTAMDGYAVRAADISQTPKILKVIGVLPAGSSPDFKIQEGEAVKIMTGAVMPPGSDAVVMIEKTKIVEEESSVLIKESVPVGNFVRLPGEDFLAGNELFTPGTIIGAAHIGVFATIGLTEIAVHKRPVVGVMSTGDELIEGMQNLKPGQIRDSNRHILLALLEEMGVKSLDLGIIRDDEQAIEESLSDAVTKCDVVLSSGGVSMGDFDYVKVVLDRLGDMRWMQIAIKPAKPLAFGLIEKVPIFGLPGNPVSAMVSFELFVRPSLMKMMGHKELWRPHVEANADGDLDRREDGKIHFARVSVVRTGDGYQAALVKGQGSHQLSSMANSQGLAVLPDGRGISNGEIVDVMLLSEPAFV